MYQFFLLLAGILQGLMTSFNGQLAHYFSVIEVSFFVHLTGVLLLLLYVVLIEKRRPSFHGAPRYVYIVGFLGIGMVALGSYCTAHIGAATLLSVSIAGQMVTSTLIDHFGWFHTKRIPIHRGKLPGFLLTAAGVVLILIG